MDTTTALPEPGTHRYIEWTDLTFGITRTAVVLITGYYHDWDTGRPLHACGTIVEADPDAPYSLFTVGESWEGTEASLVPLVVAINLPTIDAAV